MCRIYDCWYLLCKIYIILLIHLLSPKTLGEKLVLESFRFIDFWSLLEFTEHKLMLPRRDQIIIMKSTECLQVKCWYGIVSDC